MTPQLNKNLNRFSKKDNTLSRAVKDNPADKIELEIGDSKEPGQFMPQAKVMRWDNEVNLSVRRQKPQPKDRIQRLRTRVPTADVQGDHVTYDDDDETVHIYERPEAGEDGGLEIELHLKHKPDTNWFDFSIQTKELNFYYQPEITDEEAKEHMAEGDKRTLEQVKREMRPQNVVGSYAVYHATKRNNRVEGKEYKTGKFCHIYRPHITDADGNETWGELDLDEQSGLLTVVVPQAFLDKAAYPVVVDPTVGYTSLGASVITFAISEFLIAGVSTASDDATVDSITLGVLDESPAGSTLTSNIRGFLVNNDTLSFFTNSITPGAFVSTNGTVRWETVTYSTKPDIVNGQEYGIGYVTDDFFGAVYDTGTAGDSFYDGSTSYNSPPNPTDATEWTSLLSAYATYTVGSSASPPTVTTQAVNSIGETTATGNGNVTDDGGATITERGVCWSTSPTPTTADSKATAAGTTGAFTASMTGLTANTTYYVRAYATNSEGTSYGSEVSFTTNAAVSLPTVVTNAVTNIQET